MGGRNTFHNSQTTGNMNTIFIYWSWKTQLFPSCVLSYITGMYFVASLCIFRFLEEAEVILIYTKNECVFWNTLHLTARKNYQESHRNICSCEIFLPSVIIFDTLHFFKILNTQRAKITGVVRKISDLI